MRSQILRSYNLYKKRQCNLCCIQRILYSTKYSHKAQAASIDPKVEALQDKLLYSDYLESKYYKVGYQQSMIIKRGREIRKEQARTAELLETPVFSVLLDQATNDEIPSPEETDNDSSFVERTEKPLHLPYASVDKYEVVEEQETANPKLKENENSLNEAQKKLYEKYLEVRIKPRLNKFDRNIKALFTSSVNSDKSKSKLSAPSRDWMMDYEQYDDTLTDDASMSYYGNENRNAKISSVPCGGCGALLHCNDMALPGYLPSELFLSRTDDELKTMICQRCHFLKHYNTALQVNVSPEEYPKLLKVIRKRKAAIILMVDLTDFPCSIWPDIRSVIHPLTSVFVVGNKIDLLPQDHSAFLEHVKNCLRESLVCTGIKREYIKHVALVSAKTGYGVEELINKLYKLWGYKGDVYLVGCTNVGKSSLFNALLRSDYCKVQAADLIQRAVTSPWPGTTLNLLKFPILNPQRKKLHERTARLKLERSQRLYEDNARYEQYKGSGNLQDMTLQGHIGQTFSKKSDESNIQDLFSEKSHKFQTGKLGLDEKSEIYKNSCWLYDTPGTMHKDQILNLLTIEEIMLTLPKQIISPRTFILYPSQTLFLGGLGRLDYVNGALFIRCTVFASKDLPVTICRTEDADDLYHQLLTTEAFAVPLNDIKRLENWPALESKEMEVTGIYNKESVADVVLSSSGWIAITPKQGEHVLLKAWTPQGRGIYLRTPAVLKKSVALCGPRIRNTPAYQRGRQVYIKK